MSKHWEQAQIGDQIRGEVRHVDWTDMALQVSGSQDWNTVHHDPEFAKQSGHADVFFNTGWTSAALARVATDWLAPYGWLRRLEIRMRLMTSLGDVVEPVAVIVGKRTEGDKRLFDLDLSLRNEAKGVTSTGHATVEVLPGVRG